MSPRLFANVVYAWLMAHAADTEEQVKARDDVAERIRGGGPDDAATANVLARIAAAPTPT